MRRRSTTGPSAEGQLLVRHDDRRAVEGDASPVAGADAIAGTFEAAIAGAGADALAAAPRGIVRTTWLGGSGVPSFR
jgi:hypothetical protein